MATALNKAVRRKAGQGQFSRGKLRRIIITLYPNDTIGFRLEKTRQEELLPIAAAYVYATRLRVAAERRERAEARKAKKDSKLQLKRLNKELAKTFGSAAQ